MAVLLVTDAVAVMRGTPAADSHGWALPPGEDAVPVWEGGGNLQLAVPEANARAAEQGGTGPYSPAHAEGGTCYLPTESDARAGDTLVVRGKAWVVQTVQWIGDPVSVGLGCLAAVVVATDQAVPYG